MVGVLEPGVEALFDLEERAASVRVVRVPQVVGECVDVDARDVGLLRSTVERRSGIRS